MWAVEGDGPPTARHAAGARGAGEGARRRSSATRRRCCRRTSPTSTPRAAQLGAGVRDPVEVVAVRHHGPPRGLRSLTGSEQRLPTRASSRLRMTASEMTTMPQAPSARACGHSTSRPTPFRKIAADDHEEVAQRDQVGDRLDRPPACSRSGRRSPTGRSSASGRRTTRSSSPAAACREIVETNSPRPSVRQQVDAGSSPAAARSCRAAAPRTRTPRPRRRAARRPCRSAPYGSSLPTISSQRASGVTFSCSSVPSSFSRTIAIDDRFVVTTSSSSARMPGIMKSRLSSCGLNQTRTSASIERRAGGRARRPRPARARTPRPARRRSRARRWSSSRRCRRRRPAPSVGAPVAHPLAVVRRESSSAIHARPRVEVRVDLVDR